MLEGIKRAYNLFKNSSSVDTCVDSQLLERDLNIAKTAKKVLPYIALASAVGLGVSLYTAEVIPAIVTGAILVASLVALKRFGTVIAQVAARIDAVKQKVEEEAKAA